MRKTIMYSSSLRGGRDPQIRSDAVFLWRRYLNDVFDQIGDYLDEKAVNYKILIRNKQNNLDVYFQTTRLENVPRRLYHEVIAPWLEDWAEKHHAQLKFHPRFLQTHVQHQTVLVSTTLNPKDAPLGTVVQHLKG